MTDLIRAIQAKTDLVRATVVTRNFQFEADIHCPRVGKGGRLLTNLLNSPDRKFIVLTNATILNRSNGKQDPQIYPMLQVNLEAIEFILPEANAAQGEEGEVV